MTGLWERPERRVCSFNPEKAPFSKFNGRYMCTAMKTSTAIVAALFALPLSATAKEPKPVVVPIHFIDANGNGKSAGTITLRDTAEGLQLKLALSGLTPGEHGFHVHENGSCAPGEKDGAKAAGIAAGSHYDPLATKAHKGPSGEGHQGDLPKLIADDKGKASETLTASSLKLEDVTGRTLMVHEGGDNYSDAPKPLGGGGARIACGVIPGKVAHKPATPPSAPAK